MTVAETEFIPETAVSLVAGPRVWNAVNTVSILLLHCRFLQSPSDLSLQTLLVATRNHHPCSDARHFGQFNRNDYISAKTIVRSDQSVSLSPETG